MSVNRVNGRLGHQWVRLAREHDEKVATRVADKIAETATAQAITRAMQFDTPPRQAPPSPGAGELRGSRRPLRG